VSSNVRLLVPSLKVTKNDQPLCVAGSSDVWTFSASIWADIWGPEYSSLTVTGSTKPTQGKAGEFVVWHLGHELRPGDRVAFNFTASSSSSPPDQTPIEEPSPKQPVPDFFAPVPEAELVKLESRPATNTNCKWRFLFPGKPVISLALDPVRQYCGLQLTWNDHRPDRLRVNLSRSSLREITARAGGEELFVEYVPLNAQFELTVEA